MKLKNKFYVGSSSILGRPVLREWLEKELYTLDRRRDQIIEVLKELTPEAEKMIRLQNNLVYLGIMRY